MAVSKKRSLSDVQAMEPSSLKQDDDDTYRMMVLRYEESEHEVDQQFLQQALELGINVSKDPTIGLDLIKSNVDALSLETPATEPPLLSQSRASHSTNTASDSSIEQHIHRKTPSLTATSVSSASSTSSRKSNFAKVKRGFRRISKLNRRKTLASPIPDIPPRASSMLAVTRPTATQTRANTTDRVPTISNPIPHAITAGIVHKSVVPQSEVISTNYNVPPPAPVGPPPPPPEDSTLDSLVARRRSISNTSLKKLRTSQLQEQLRFISFEASQHRLMRTRQLQQKRDGLAKYHQLQEDTQARQAEALSVLENRHLTAEVDLNRTLQLERQACDTKLKHMQAYCNPRSTVEGMPSRVVTKSDYRALEQQYHIRNGMHNLHESRINVLRERQGKQLERIIGKQETEMEALEADFERQNEELDVKFKAEEVQLQQEFTERKNRLVARWTIAELIERRKLQLQTGEEYGPLPVIEWSYPTVSRRGSKSDPQTDSQVYDTDSAYDAMNMI